MTFKSPTCLPTCLLTKEEGLAIVNRSLSLIFKQLTKRDISNQQVLAFSKFHITSNYQAHHFTDLLHSCTSTHSIQQSDIFRSSLTPLHCFEFSRLVDRRPRPLVVTALFLLAASFVLLIRKSSLASGKQPSLSIFSSASNVKAETILALRVLEQPSCF